MALSAPITAQSTASDCHTTFASGRRRKIYLNVDSDGVFHRASRLDDACQQIVFAIFHPCFFHSCHYCLIANLFGKFKMYNSIREELYWLQIADDVYTTVSACRSCAQKGAHKRKKRQLKLYFLDVPLKYANTAILEAVS